MTTKTRGGSLRRPMHRNGVSCIIQPVKSSPQDRQRLIPRPGSSNSCDLVVVSRRCRRRRRSYWQWWRDCLGIWLCLTVLVSLWFHGRRREEPGPPLVGRLDEPIIATTVQWVWAPPPSRRHAGNAVRSPHNKSPTTTSTGGDDGDGLPNGNRSSVGESRASAAGHPDEPKPSSSRPNASSSQSFDQVFETIWTNHASLDHPMYVLTKRRQQQQHGSTTNGWEMQGDGVAQLHYCTILIMTPTGNPTGLAADLNATTTTWQFWKDFSQWAHPLWQRTLQTFERQHAQFHWRNGPNASNRTETTPNQFSAGSTANRLERITHDLQQQVLFQLLELYAQYHDMCQYQSYRPTLPPSVYQQDDWKALVQQLKRPVATTTTRTTTPPRLLLVLVAYRDLVLLQHVIAAVHQPQHVIVVHLERSPTRSAQRFAQAVQEWIRQSSWSNVVCVTFGTIVYGTDSVSQLHWTVWNWYVQQQEQQDDEPSSHRRRWFDYYIALDGASFPLWSPQELARQLQIQNQWAWLGPQLHKGQVLGAAAASTNLSSSSSLLTSSLGQQSLLLLRRKRLFFTSHDFASKNDNDQEETLYWKWTMRLPAQTFVTHNNNKNNNKQQTHSPTTTTTTLGALKGDAALVEALVRGGKTHSGNTAIYHESILHSMVHSAQVQELFAKSKYAAFCCMEERIWSAALQLLHLPSPRPPPIIIPSGQGTQEEDLKRTTARVAPQESATFFPPAVFQTYGGTKPGVCESSKRNAVLMGKQNHRSGTYNTKGIQGEWNNNENDETNKERSNEVLPFCYKLDDVTMVLLDRQGDTNLTKHQLPFVWSSRKPGGGECLEGDPTVISPSSLTKTQHGNSTIHTNAPLDQNPPSIRNSSPALNQCDAYFWSNETLHFLHRARQLGFLFARKFDSSQPESLQLLQDIQRQVW